MKKIAILIDFTEGAKKALIQALLLAKRTNASLIAINIAASKEKIEASETDLSEFLKACTEDWKDIQIEIGVGDLFAAVPSVMKKIEPDLVIVCTHGVKGFVQHLFGAHILKLVQAIPYPSIVLQENNKVNLSEIKTILFPLGPHPEFDTKIQQTTKFAREFSAKVILYEIDRPGLDVENQMEKNLARAKAIFNENGVQFERILDDLKVISAGYSRQTLEYAVENNVSVISLMATISKNDVLFGVADKENFLVNTYGIPVLCCMA